LELTDTPFKFEDGNSHVIERSRDRGGRMVVKVAGAQVMEVADRGLRDPLDGIALVNGGDYAIRDVTVDGTGQ
jgi:hypothetical protein